MSIANLFNQVYNIPSIPKLVQELINNFDNENSNSREIAKKLQMDQALSAKVLRLANSARYGAGRKINSIDSAVIILGFDTLKTLVIASGVTSACKNIPGLNQKQFWRTSFAVANIAKMLAKLAKADLLGLSPVPLPRPARASTFSPGCATVQMRSGGCFPPTSASRSTCLVSR